MALINHAQMDWKRRETNPDCVEGRIEVAGLFSSAEWEAIVAAMDKLIDGRISNPNPSRLLPGDRR